MAMSDAAVIAHARALWPALTATSAPDLFLLAWLPWARSLADEGQFDASYDDAIANLIAHAAYQVDPVGAIGSAGAGAVTSVSTGKLSVGYAAGGVPAVLPVVDASLWSTKPGHAFLSIRDSIPTIVAPFGV